MGKKYKIACILLFVMGVVVLTWLFLMGAEIPVMNPKGLIAEKQSSLIIVSTWLMLIVVIPVFLLAIGISWRYRAKNSKAKFTPDWDYNALAESIWWGLPCIIVIALSVLVWKSSHDLDPFKPIDSTVKPMTIQVVALQWKWLFIYPEQGIATINLVQFPEKTPIHFEITADAPMNSFWIPQLGGQIYAMPGMKSQLNLIANEVGSYKGSSANLSGLGFAGMRFVAVSSTDADFETWVAQAKRSSNSLGQESYKQLVKPSEYNSVETFTLTEPDLYDQIVMRYMMPQGNG